MLNVVDNSAEEHTTRRCRCAHDLNQKKFRNSLKQEKSIRKGRYSLFFACFFSRLALHRVFFWFHLHVRSRARASLCARFVPPRRNTYIYLFKWAFERRNQITNRKCEKEKRVNERNNVETTATRSCVSCIGLDSYGKYLNMHESPHIQPCNQTNELEV